MWFIHKKEDYKCIKLANSNWLLSSITEESVMNGFAMLIIIECS